MVSVHLIVLFLIVVRLLSLWYDVISLSLSVCMYKIFHGVAIARDFLLNAQQQRHHNNKHSPKQGNEGQTGNKREGESDAKTALTSYCSSFSFLPFSFSPTLRWLYPFLSRRYTHDGDHVGTTDRMDVEGFNILHICRNLCARILTRDARIV